MDDDAQEYRGAGLLASGKSSLYCCLSCGMPFAFPDAAYTSDDREVLEVLTMVHRVRNEIRHSEQGRGGSPQMWQVRGRAKCMPPTHHVSSPSNSGMRIASHVSRRKFMAK